MVTAVAQCGVDLNAAVAHPWRAPALQFVPGLGPRKAAVVLSNVAKSPHQAVDARCVCVCRGVFLWSASGAGNRAPCPLVPRRTPLASGSGS